MREEKRVPWCGLVFVFLWFVFCEWVGGWLLVSDVGGKKGRREEGKEGRRDEREKGGGTEGGSEGERELVGFLRAVCVCVCACVRVCVVDWLKERD